MTQNTISLIWIIGGIVIMLLELMVPGLVIVFFGAAALVVGLLNLTGIIDSLIHSFTLWFILSIVFVLVFRKIFMKLFPADTSYQLIEDDVLGDLDEEVNELQALYEPYLKLRDLSLEEIDLGKFIEDNYNVKTDISCIIKLDQEKLRFVFDFLIELSEENYELDIKPSGRGYVVTFISPSFAKLSIDDFDKLSDEIEKLPFFAVKKILGRMGAEFSIEGEEISIEFLCNTE